MTPVLGRTEYFFGLVVFTFKKKHLLLETDKQFWRGQDKEVQAGTESRPSFVPGHLLRQHGAVTVYIKAVSRVRINIRDGTEMIGCLFVVGWGE